MKRISILFALIICTLGAVELQGRIGMGLGFAPDGVEYFMGEPIALPIVDIGVTKYGLSPSMAIEPIVQFTMISVGDGGSVTSTKIKFFGLFDFLLKGHKKTNIYGKAGLGLGMSSTGVTDQETEISFELPFGFGLEHFCSEHFSINLCAMSGLKYVSNPANEEGSYLALKLGNDKPFAFYLLWYY
uniref:Outer membrane protein beta-barrel domain-containing protein n=1 Tax=candidate division WOR-3 bacterium TaxID=2052148 RepID=A0A7C4XVB3_UNCW3